MARAVPARVRISGSEEGAVVCRADEQSCENYKRRAKASPVVSEKRGTYSDVGTTTTSKKIVRRKTKPKE